jgi:cytochrome c oxidase subunit IV
VSDAAHGGNPYRVYLITWAILLVITVAMLGAELFHLPRIFLILFLVVFMMVKASMIAGNFMHLRFERRNLSWMVGAGILVTSLILYTFITPESLHVRNASQQPVKESGTAPHPGAGIQE